MSAFDPILTLDEDTLKPPETRIGSIAGVRSRISELKEGDDFRSGNRAIVQGLIDGNPPYIQAQMDEMGRGDDANINFREAEGDVAAATTPYYELAFGVPRAANAEFYFPGADKSKNYEWSEAISQRYSETLWAWKGYKINKQISHYQMVVHGRGPIIWDTKRGWYFESKRDDSVWVSDNAYCDLDTIEEMVIPGHFDPVELFKKIDTDVAKSNGWDVKLAKHAITKAAPRTLRDTYHGYWTQYQASLRRGDSQWWNKAARIYYKNYLVKEFDGKISHCIVLDNEPDDKDEKVEDGFLYRKIGKYDSLSQLINPFFFDVGPDGQWYSVKGLGPKIYDFRDLSNRFKCTLINGAAASVGIWLQAKSGQAMQKIQETPIIRASGCNFAPPDWEAMQIQYRAQLDGPLQVDQMINSTLEGNIGQYRQRGFDENTQPTLGQQQLSVTSQTTLTRVAYDRYYHYMDDMHEEILRRMLDPKITERDSGGKEALEMRRKLIEEDGVPEEVLDFKYLCSIQAVRNVGYGSPQYQQVVADKMLALIGTMNPEGRQNALRMIGGNYMNHSQVDRFWKKYEELGMPTGQEQKAKMENMLLRLPQAQLEVIPEDNPLTHFNVHFEDAINHVKQVQGGQGDPVGLITHLDNAGPHNHQHLEAMKGDPTLKDEYKQFVKMQMMLGKVADQLKKEVAKSQKNGQQSKPGIDPKMIEGILKVQLDAKTKDTKMQLDEARKDRKAEFETRRKDNVTAADIYRKRAEMMQ